MSDKWTFQVESLTKEFGSTVANDRIDLRVEPGEIYGLLGPNGAGKSTLVKQTIGLLKPTSGTITLGPVDLVASPKHARQLCSYLPQAPVPIDSFSVTEAIELVGRLRGGRPSTVRKQTSRLIESLEIGEWRGERGRDLSGGIRRIVGFCMATVCPGRLVILDEPTNDIDPLRRRLLWEEVQRIGGRGAAVLLVTHNVLEAERSVDRLAIIDEGRVVAEGTPSVLKAADRSDLRLQIMLAPGAPTPPLPTWSLRPVRIGHHLIVSLRTSDAAAGIKWAAELIEMGSAEEYALTATTLEDAYIRLTSSPSGSQDQ